jgi:dihydropteroate synthase
MLNLTQPIVMGILNITPDSFSDGGLYLDVNAALNRAAIMVAEGASIVDIGGESTRPGSLPVSVQEELDRVIPVVERLVYNLPVPISIDTSKPDVIYEALKVGASLINDVRAFQLPGALEAIASSNNAYLCIVHMQGQPETMQREIRYANVVKEVYEFLAERVKVCEMVGILNNRIFVDPGFGFGKTLAHNLSLLKNLNSFTELAAGVAVGISRKSMIGTLLDAPVSERLSGGLAMAALAVWQGARIIRTHDVRATVEALRACTAVLAAD